MLVGAGAVALILGVGALLLTTGGNGASDDAGGSGAGASDRTTTSSIAASSHSADLEATTVHDDLGVIGTDTPIVWSNDGTPGQGAFGEAVPTLIAATDPSAFTDPVSRFGTAGVRFVERPVDGLDRDDPSQAQQLLDDYLASAASASGLVLGELCSVGEPEPTGTVSGYKGLRISLTSCGGTSTMGMVAALVSPDGRSAVMVEAQAVDAKDQLAIIRAMSTLTVTEPG